LTVWFPALWIYLISGPNKKYKVDYRPVWSSSMLRVCLWESFRWLLLWFLPLFLINKDRYKHYNIVQLSLQCCCNLILAKIYAEVFHQSCLLCYACIGRNGFPLLELNTLIVKVDVDYRSFICAHIFLCAPVMATDHYGGVELFL
jgi:hypothetical protein